MRGTLNRVLLGLTGLALLVLGLAVLTGALDLQRRWGFTLPGGWPFDGPDDVLLPDADRTRYRDQGWWWPAVFTVLGVLAALLLWWLLAQLGNRRLRQVYAGGGDDHAVVRGRALENILAAETEALDGVGHARVVLTGSRQGPEARMVLGLVPHARPAAVIAGLETEILKRARASAALDRLPAKALLHIAGHRPSKVT